MFLKDGTLKCPRFGSPNVNMSRPQRFKTPPKFHKKTPKRGKKERTLWRENEKSAKFGPLPPFEALPLRGPDPDHRPPEPDLHTTFYN